MNVWWFLSLLIGLTGLASLFIIYPFKHRFKAAFFLVPLIFVTAFTGYFCWGSFGEWQQFVHQRAIQEQAQKVLQSVKSPQELIEKLRAKLDDTPKSARGWYLLGRLYASQGDKKNAVNAFAKAYQFHRDDEQYAVNYAHSLWVSNNQQFTKQIRGIFHQLLKNNPNQPDALAMLAMDSFVSHAYEHSINYWQRLLNNVPAQSAEAQTIRKAIAQAEEQIKLRDINRN